MSHHDTDIAAMSERPASIVAGNPRRKRTAPGVRAPKVVKKSRKLSTTPRSKIRSALRQVWLRSREHQACLKAAGRACERCGVKASVAKGREVKLQVHHRNGITGWEKVIDLVFAELLVDPVLLEAICVECHKAEHGGVRLN